MKAWYKYLIALIVGLIVGLLIDINNKPESKIEYIPVVDTVVVEKERIVNNTKIVNTKDTIVKTILVNDTITDSVFVYLPIEYKEYSDTIKNDSSETKIKINYHGIYSDIDSIKITNSYYNKKETIIKKPKKIGLDLMVGPYVGYGINCNSLDKFNNGFQVGIGVSIGLGYRITK